MAPAAYVSEIRAMVAKYKERLRPIARREAKYREGIPDLPDVIHITSTVQTNLDFMAKMSSSDIWSKAPPSVKSSPSAVASAAANRSAPSDASANSDNTAQWPSLVKRPGLDVSNPIKSVPKSGANLPLDDRADTASTHSLTNTLRSSTTMRMMELENQMRECRELLRSNREAARDSSDRLAANEQSLRETMETITEMTHTVAGLQTQFAGFNITMESMRLMLHTLMHQSSANSVQVESNFSSSAFPSFPMPHHQLTTISESTRTTELQGTGDSTSVASEDSMYRRSPEKKKTRKYDEQNISNSASPPVDLEDVQMCLFEEGPPDETQDTVIANALSGQSHDDLVRQSTSQTHKQNSSPPDAQYTNPSDPAGREDT
ncbi:hypothetical protein MHU86_20949 [Fragilaria crotonensis]|nr:hypothetical protein MHU86_20949 [Fragilaria crotonensis]